MRISDWSSDVCSSDLLQGAAVLAQERRQRLLLRIGGLRPGSERARHVVAGTDQALLLAAPQRDADGAVRLGADLLEDAHGLHHRSEEHTSELQSLMRISYDVFCLKKKHVQNEITLSTIL